MRKRIYFSTIDKDVRRVLGKRLYQASTEKNGGWIVAERSNGDAEYHLTHDAYRKLKQYIFEHRQSRLSKSYTGVRGDKDCTVRFEIDSWQ